MYQNGCGCNGLGDATSAILPIAGALIGGPAGAAVGSAAAGAGGAGSGGSGGAMPITVSPQLSTQISPQISPVFQQQFQPQNSGMTAGTAMTGAPVSAGSGMPGMPTPYSNTPGYAPAPAIPGVPQTGQNWAQYMPYALAGLGIVAFVSLKKRKVK